MAPRTADNPAYWSDQDLAEFVAAGRTYLMAHHPDVCHPAALRQFDVNLAHPTRESSIAFIAIWRHFAESALELPWDPRLTIQ